MAHSKIFCNQLKYMSNYRRSRKHGGTFFFTVITYKRQPFLISQEARITLRNAINETRQTLPFIIDAWVLLPDHIHCCIWTLPEGDSNFSKRWGLIKAKFSKQMRSTLFKKQSLTASRDKHRESTIWQRRFWEHTIQDNRDYRTHMDYIHYNPVKHELVQKIQQWPWSTFHRYVRQGMYPADWAESEVQNIEFVE